MKRFTNPIKHKRTVAAIQEREHSRSLARDLKRISSWAGQPKLGPGKRQVLIKAWKQGYLERFAIAPGKGASGKGILPDYDKDAVRRSRWSISLSSIRSAIDPITAPARNGGNLPSAT